MTNKRNYELFNQFKIKIDVNKNISISRITCNISEIIMIIMVLSSFVIAITLHQVNVDLDHLIDFCCENI